MTQSSAKIIFRGKKAGDGSTFFAPGSPDLRYADEGMWQVSQPVQFFLDVTAYQRGLLNEAERTRIEEFVERMES